MTNSPTTKETPDLEAFFGPNAGYVAEQLERYQQAPEKLDAAVRGQIAQWLGGYAAPSTSREEEAARVSPPVPPGPTAAAGAASLAQAIRFYGHLAAQLDPLGSPPPGDPQLDPAAHGVDDATLRRLPGSVVSGPVGRAARDAFEAIQRLRAIYSATTGYELAHIQAPEERAWLLESVEDERFRPPNDPVDEHRLLDRLTEVSAFERFLQRAYPGQTRFSVEGLGMQIPMLDELIDRASEAGTRTILLGMAHRGRLNVLAHVLGKSYRRIVAEFEGRIPALRAAPFDSSDAGWTGDVKYHAGGRRAYPVEGESASDTVAVVMAPNPSHLELVDPVVQGMARAADQSERGGPERSALAVLIHGDAAFMGQGTVAETLNLSRLAGYEVGGTIHLIANNQLGFTTRPPEGRSTLYASDLARAFEMPIMHVNADDPVACLAAVRLAVAYRAQFHKDALIDLVGYRRWGHNEGDEPSFTQPAMYAKIAQHPTVRERFAAHLVQRGVVAEGEPERLLRAGLDEFQRIREAVLAQTSAAGGEALPVEQADERTPTKEPAASQPQPAQAVPWDVLRALNQALAQLPEGFALNPKLERPLQRRHAAFEAPDGTLDWGHAETLAFASILRDGTPVRFTGQDAVRGTFSQRHLTFYDAHTGEPYTPLGALESQYASFAAYNSPLSESAPLGFEYGFSIQAPHTLVLWEAQYGDFVNMAQAVVDEFIVSGQAKWGLVSGLVLLLPHAWEGQGPDHSSARLERFLALAAEDNIRVVNCTTAAQYFFLLRRQSASLRASPRPLVVMTPKSLLRHPLAAAPARALTEGGFQPVLDDTRAAQHADAVQRVVLCSGKVWMDLEAARASGSERAGLAAVRVEELYPFPGAELRRVLQQYAQAQDIIWLQEEPRNMGAWSFVKPHLRDLLAELGGGRTLRYVGRPRMASPAEGWADVHAAEQRRIVHAALEGVQEREGVGDAR